MQAQVVVDAAQAQVQALRALELRVEELQEQVTEQTRAEAATDGLAQEFMVQVAQLTGLLRIAEQEGTAAKSQGAHTQVQWDSLHRFMYMVHASFMEEYRKPALAGQSLRSHIKDCFLIGDRFLDTLFQFERALIQCHGEREYNLDCLDR